MNESESCRHTGCRGHLLRVRHVVQCTVVLVLLSGCSACESDAGGTFINIESRDADAEVDASSETEERVNYCAEDLGGMPDGHPRPVCVGKNDRYATASYGFGFHGGRIVFLDSRMELGKSVQVHDISAGVTISLPVRCDLDELPAASSSKLFGGVDVNGELVSYGCHYRLGESEFFHYSLFNLADSRISLIKDSDGSGLRKAGVRMSNSHVVWIQATSEHDIGMSYEIESGREIPVASSAQDDVSMPRVDGSRVVYAGDLYTSDHADIKLRDLKTGERLEITDDVHRQWHPSIHGDRVVWADLRNGELLGGSYPGIYSNSDIYMYILSDGTEIQITTDPSVQDRPAVRGNIVAWKDLRHGYVDPGGHDRDSEIYIKDLLSGEEIRVTYQGGLHSRPTLWGNYLAWKRVGAGQHFSEAKAYYVDISGLVGRDLME